MQSPTTHTPSPATARTHTASRWPRCRRSTRSLTFRSSKTKPARWVGRQVSAIRHQPGRVRLGIGIASIKPRPKPAQVGRQPNLGLSESPRHGKRSRRLLGTDQPTTGGTRPSHAGDRSLVENRGYRTHGSISQGNSVSTGTRIVIAADVAAIRDGTSGPPGPNATGAIRTSLCGDLSQRRAFLAHCNDHWIDLLIGSLHDRCSALQVVRQNTFRLPPSFTPRDRAGQSRLGASADHRRFTLGDCS